jgi:CubicO group peptidase (beta-lactamase class C family)
LFNARSILLAALLIAALPPTAQADPIDRIVLAEMQRQRSPAIAVAVVKDGVATKVRGYGFANLEHRSPASESTLFQTASVGKQFVAALVMLLVRDGKLGLDQPVASYLPGAPPAWAGMTVRHLLDHTSGLPRIDAAIDLRKDYAEDELLQSAYQVALESAPGARHEYSDLGYQVLGFLCSKVGGRFYGDQLRERLFAPLGMGTRVISEQAIIPGRAAGYERVDGRFGNQRWVAPSLNTTADGSLYASARDMARWAIELQRGTILRRPELEAMWHPTTLAGGARVDYGLGWALAEVAGHRVVQHRGDWQGFTSHILHLPQTRLTITVLMNRAQAQPEVIVDRIAALSVKGWRKPVAMKPDNAALLSQPVFLRGTMNEWKAALPFVRVAPRALEARVTLAPGLHEFKVGDADWKAVDFGVPYDAPLAQTDVPQRLAFKGENLVMAVTRPGEYRFRLALPAQGAPVFTIAAPDAIRP